MESHEDELIVGKSLVLELGIDIGRELEMLAAQSVDSGEDPSPAVEVPEPLHVKFDAAAIVEMTIEDAVRKGFPLRKWKSSELCALRMTSGGSHLVTTHPHLLSL